jgi:hypothetical protein
MRNLMKSCLIIVITIFTVNILNDSVAMAVCNTGQSGCMGKRIFNNGEEDTYICIRIYPFGGKHRDLGCLSQNESKSVCVKPLDKMCAIVSSSPISIPNDCNREFIPFVNYDPEYCRTHPPKLYRRRGLGKGEKTE